jgi:hypothetical protein
MSAEAVTMRAVARRDVVQCGRCGHACSADAWRTLPREQALTRDDLARVVSDWPDGVTVEVRACGGCGAPVARAVRASAARPRA